MGKDDWYFAISTVLALLALFGVDWRSLKAKIPTSLWGRNGLFLALILGSLAMSVVGWYQSTHRNYLRWHMTPAEEQVFYGQSYRNEKVEMDGKKFDHCKFENVTLMYHSIEPAELLECQISGCTYLRTDNDAAMGFVKIEEALRHMPNFTMSGVAALDDKGNVYPITPGIPAALCSGASSSVSIPNNDNKK